MEALKTVLITGANKGLGYGIAENLLLKPFRIILACRNLELANASREQLLKKHNVPEDRLHTIQLDISDSASIDSFLKEFEQRFQKVDVLVNNAGMAFKGDEFNHEIVATTFKTNFYGTVELTEKFLPFLNERGKVVIIGSTAGRLRILKSEELQNRFRNPALKKEELFALAQEFYEDVKAGNYAEKGWPQWGYGVSKSCINVYARVLTHHELVKERQLQVYACCPGWVKTDMAGQEAELTIEEGALTPVYLVELPHEVNPEFQGRFFYLKKVEEL